MTLPTGTISMSQVNVELSLSPTATISLNDAAVRGLAAVPSGLIDLQDLQGKSALFAYTITTNQTDLNLRTLAIANGWNGTFAAQITINSGVTVGGSVAANSTPALIVDGSWPNGVTLINNGTIAGRGGAGGSTATGGQAGGLAFTASVAVTVQNNGTIAGGGGGGGGAANLSGSGNCDMGESSCSWFRAGGGGGGGRSNAVASASGGSPNGGTGTSSGPGLGGVGGTSSGVCPSCNGTGFSGGNGGDWGGAGGASGSGQGGGAAGTAITGNSNITWTAFGTRLGAIT